MGADPGDVTLDEAGLSLLLCSLFSSAVALKLVTGFARGRAKFCLERWVT